MIVDAGDLPVMAVVMIETGHTARIEMEIAIIVQGGGGEPA